MAAFLDFPEELILEVVGFVLPEDLENFAQSCKRIRSAACSALKQHRQLIRQHSLMKTEGGRTISKTLKEVLVNPVIGHYITDVSLGYVTGSRRNIDPNYNAEDLELFVTATMKSEILSSSGPSQFALYRELIERGNEDILLAILLPLLPNLRSLRLPRVSYNGDRCWTSYMFGHLPHISASTLPKLSTICINANRIYFHLDEARAYVNLPSVRSLSAPRLYAENCCDTSLFSAANSNITRLELWDCRVASRSLRDFLLGFNCLQSFIYTCDLPEHLRNDFDAFLIRSALLAKARSTLRKLTILACRRPSPMMGTLRPFEVLAEICTDLKLLVSDMILLKPLDKSLLAMSVPNSLRKLRLHVESGYYWTDYTPLINSAVRAQKRGTHVQPRLDDNLAKFEYGLQLQELTILSEPDLEESTIPSEPDLREPTILSEPHRESFLILPAMLMSKPDPEQSMILFKPDPEQSMVLSEPGPEQFIEPITDKFLMNRSRGIMIPFKWYQDCKDVGIALGWRNYLLIRKGEGEIDFDDQDAREAESESRGHL